MERFRDNDASYERWLADHPDLYILNTGGPGPPRSGGSGEFDHVQEQVSHTVSPGAGGRGASVTGLDTLPDMRRVIRSSGNGASTGDLTDRE